MAADTARDTFHEGERYAQERTGERDIALRRGGLVDATIPPRAMPFLAEQRMLVIGTVDRQGVPVASVLFGAPGLASSADGVSVVLDRRRIACNLDDPIWNNLSVGAKVALLAIDLDSRRRLRINGVVSSLDNRSVVVSVREAYPNCSKYIQRRQWREEVGVPHGDLRSRASGVPLDDARTLAVERADTFFVASRHSRGLDVSHRGGMPGFVGVLDPTRLRIPDYHGNSMFNTLGNFVADNRAGLVFVDFERRSLLQMTGTADIHFDMPEDTRQPSGGTGRYWDFHIARWLEVAIPAHVAWEPPEYSPQNPSLPA
jgi:predicted pyridoxine 5'-phosphate oxidase superfamily flavin-nucleotide-binding protein